MVELQVFFFGLEGAVKSGLQGVVLIHLDCESVWRRGKTGEEMVRKQICIETKIRVVCRIMTRWL